MFSFQNIKTGLLGASLAVGAMGLANEASAVEPLAPVPASETYNENLYSEQGETLNVQSGMERFSGALKSVEAPLYDGAVYWGRQCDSSILLGAAAGLFTGFMGFVAGESYDRRHSSYDVGYMGKILGTGLGFAIPLGMGLYNYDEIRLVQFDTTVNATINDDSPHTEMVRSGKTNVEMGPFFGQLIYIPETNLPLAANNFGSPLIDGQKIKASFYLDADNHIISWQAEPGAR